MCSSSGSVYAVDGIGGGVVCVQTSWGRSYTSCVKGYVGVGAAVGIGWWAVVGKTGGAGVVIGTDDDDDDSVACCAVLVCACAEGACDGGACRVGELVGLGVYCWCGVDVGVTLDDGERLGWDDDGFVMSKLVIGVCLLGDLRLSVSDVGRARDLSVYGCVLW